MVSEKTVIVVPQVSEALKAELVKAGIKERHIEMTLVDNFSSTAVATRVSFPVDRKIWNLMSMVLSQNKELAKGVICTF